MTTVFFLLFAVLIVQALLFCVEQRWFSKKDARHEEDPKRSLKEFVHALFLSGASCFFVFTAYFHFQREITGFLNLVTDAAVVDPHNVVVYTDDPGF
jgi:hypothetical protein